MTRTMVPEWRPFAALVACALMLTASGCARAEMVEVTLGEKVVRVYVASTPEELGRGLQDSHGLDAGEGMLFVYPDTAPRTFAMLDVTFPIDVVFIAVDNTVSAIVPLDPGDATPVRSPGACPYVLELPQGWAAENGITVGSTFARNDG
ncbi:MAG: DUF192 domain-containing protein [Coriobacteriia bacterium]